MATKKKVSNQTFTFRSSTILNTQELVLEICENSSTEDVLEFVKALDDAVDSYEFRAGLAKYFVNHITDI